MMSFAALYMMYDLVSAPFISIELKSMKFALM